MPCETVEMPGGTTAMVGSRGRRWTRMCSVCKVHRGTRLCDGRTAVAGKTCDAPLCAACTFSPSKEVDFCPTHREQAGQRTLDLRIGDQGDDGGF